MKKNILLSFIIIFCVCSKQQIKIEPPIIPAAYERLYIAPIVSEANLEGLSGWPKDAATQQNLVNYILEIRKKLKQEFIRCEKYGYYEIVEDTSSYPTMRISVTLLSATLQNDSLRIPVNMQVERIPDGQKFIYSLPAFSTTPKTADRVHFLGSLLYNYKRQFPYKELVSFFYPNHFQKD